MARRKKPDELVQETPDEVSEEFSVSDPEPESEPESETKRPKDAVLGYMRERYGHY